MLDKNVLISCIFIGLALVVYFFYWNRLLALILGSLIRVVYWNSEGSRIWFDIGSIHFSVLAGRILLKDVRYHSSNQTVRIVKGQIQWRYWIRRPTSEDELSSPVGEEAKPPFRPLSCRIQVSLQGFEWFLYNRTAAYDDIVSQMDKNGSLSERRKFTAASADATTEHFLRIPSFLKSALLRVKNQLPNLDPMDLFPIGIEGFQGVIVLGNRSTLYHLVSEFQRAEGTYGYVQAKSKHDLYRSLLTMKFHRVSMNFIENEHYVDPMTMTGKLVHDCISQYASPEKNTQPRTFVKLWRQLNLLAFMDKYMTSQSELWQRRSTFSHKKRLDDATPIGADFSEVAYAMETKLLDTPVLDLSYYFDVPGLVPADAELSPKNAKDHFNIGNGDTDPEWGIDIVISKGAIRYGPWTDRQRGDLQRLFFPPSWQNVDVTPRLEPGDQRLWTTMQILVELRDNTTLQIPFREVSKDWQWDGACPVPNRPRKREPASLLITAGDSSSVRFTIPMVANHNGYESILEVHLDAVAITSSLNDISLVQAETCRIRCGMPSPLQWNAERTWHISITFRDPIVYLVRDQINMFIDLGKDWSSAPPHDYHRFVPTIYVVDFDMHHYNLNTYLNDNNIIDRPHVKEENVLFTTSASYIKSKVTIPSNIFRPEKTTVSFSVDAPEALFVLSLPRWNTNALHAPKGGNTLGRAHSIRLEGTYLYFSQVRNDNIEQLHLKLTGREVVYKALGWSIRYFMALKDNYFGSFTHFSTLGEFLAKKDEGLPFGDPIVLKYRPGKNNMLQVTLAVDVSDGTVVVPAGLPGYESVSDWDTPGKHGIGPCLLLHVPELQLHLRLHDYFMEMTLNIGTLSGLIDPDYPERLRVSKRRASNAQDLIMIDRIDISAYRFFGPHPRTVTYVCIWEIQLGQVRTVLSASDARILAAAGDAFRVNFVDLFNAPSADFLPHLDPDVTFCKVSIKEVDVTWRTHRAAFSVIMPLGFKVDMNDLGSQYHQRVTSLRIPDIVVKLLVSGKQDRSPWLEAAAFETHVSMDIYSAPRQHRSHTRKQTAFIQEQDAPTGRAQRMLRHYLRAAAGDAIAEERVHINNVYLPQPVVPDLSHGTRTHKGTRIFRRASHGQPTKLPETSDSDPETGISEAERDARLAKTRSVTPIPQTIVEEDITSGDESDDADLTDGSLSDSVWSDEDSSDFEELLLMHYSRACRHYKLRRGGLETIWEGSPFILVKDKSILVTPSSESSPPRIGPVMATHKYDDGCDVTTLHVNITGTSEARLTPLTVSAMVLLEEDTEHRLLGPELWIDSLLIKQLGIFLDSGKPRSRLDWKVHVSSAMLQVVQHISMLDEFHPFVSLDVNKDQPPSKLDNMATLELGIQDLATSGTTKPGSLAFQFSLGSLSANMRTTLDHLPVLPSFPGETSFAITLKSSMFSFDPTSLNLDLGPINVSIGQRSPEFILATGLGIAHTAQHAMAVVKRWQAFADATHRVTVFNVLTFSKDIPIVEPLSTIQPSFLVQRGVPSGLRLDARFKFLFHLRDCLGNLKPEQRALLHVITFTDDADWREELESRSHALDPDMSVTPIESLFRKPEGVQATEDTRQRFEPLNFVSVRSNGVAFDVLQPSGKAVGQFRLSELRSVVRVASYGVVRTASAKNLSQTSLRSDKRLPAQRTLVSLVLGDITMVLSPHVMTFFQHAVRLKPTLAERELVNPYSPASAAKKQPRFITLEITVSLNRLHIQAAAENLILEIGTGRVQAASSSLSKSQDHSDYSSNNALFVGTSYFRARSPQTAQVDGHDILAALEIANGTMSLVTRQEPRSRIKIRLVTSFGDLQLNVPRSALRLYRFVEEWRDDYLPGLESTVKSLLSEIKKTSKVPQSEPNLDQRTAVIQIHGMVDHLGVSLQVMHGTWLSLDIRDTVGYVVSANPTSPTTSYAFGLQLSSMALRISAKPSMQFKMALPPFTVSGHYDSRSVYMLALVDFINLKIKPVDWDKLLVVQQKFGQDFNDLLSLMQEASSKRAMSRKASAQREVRLKYRGYLKMKGFRIGLEGMSSTLYLECQDISSGLNNVSGSAWDLTLSNLALSLAPRSIEQSGTAFSRRQRSAFVIIDIMVKTESQDVQASLDVEKHLRIAVTKIHAVMQASSISEMNDFVDELQIEVLSRKEQRSLELAAFKEKARNILKTFEVRVKDTSSDKTTWLDTYVVDIVVQHVGVALPLTHDPELQLPEKRTQETPAVRAFLFSIVKVEFGTHRGESGQAAITQLSFQFVPRFRQSVSSDFLGDNHQTRNRLLYPEMKARLQYLQLLTMRRIWMEAVVSGFILDLDSTIPDYVFSAIDVYHQGRESVERLSATVPRSQWSPTQSPLLGLRAEESTSTSGIFTSLKFSSGKIRLFSEQASDLTKSFLSGSLPKDVSDDQLMQRGVEIVNLPEVSVWAEYRATPLQKMMNTDHPEPPTLIFKSTVHSSENTLRPTLLHFLTEVVNSIEDRLRKPSHKLASHPLHTTLKMPITPSTPSTSTANLGLRISFSLRIDRSRLELTCRPDVNVMAGLHWESGGFVITVTPATQKVTFTGVVGELTAGLKHGFLSEDCVRLDARNLAFSVTFGKLHPSHSVSSLSVVLDTEFLCDVRFSRLQDVLCFKAVWLDNIPVLNTQLSAPSSSTKATTMSGSGPSAARSTTSILLRVRRIKANVDLGQSISTVTLELSDAILRTKLSESLYELSIFVGALDVNAKGNMAGCVHVQDCVFRTSRRMDDFSPGQGRMLDVRMTSGPVIVDLDSEHQKLLRYRAEPIAIEIYDDWSVLPLDPQASEQPLHLAFTVASREILAIVTIGTIPKLMMYADRFEANLDAQREGASRESNAFKKTRTPKVDNPLSAVAEAMLESAKIRLKRAESTFMYLIQQHMSFRLDRLQLVVFPRTLEDIELASFIGGTVRARLNRLVSSGDFPAHRDLHLSFSSLGISRYVQLSHRAASGDPKLECHEWLKVLLNGAVEATIVGLPAMRMRMISDEAISGQSKHLAYDFNSEFIRRKGRKQEPEDIFITLNVSLYSWLTVLRKNLTREMEQVRATAKIGVTSPRSSRRPTDLKESLVLTSPIALSALPIVEKPSSVPESPMITSPGITVREGDQADIIYEPRSRGIERLKLRQLGEATPDVMHPFFMKKSGFNLEESLPQYVHEYATLPLEEIMEILLKLYHRQFPSGKKRRP